MHAFLRPLPPILLTAAGFLLLAAGNEARSAPPPPQGTLPPSPGILGTSGTYPGSAAQSASTLGLGQSAAVKPEALPPPKATLPRSPTPFLDVSIAKLDQLLRQGDPMARSQALNALRQLAHEDPQALAVLLNDLRVPDPVVRTEVVRAPGRAETPVVPGPGLRGELDGQSATAFGSPGSGPRGPRRPSGCTRSGGVASRPRPCSAVGRGQRPR